MPRLPIVPVFLVRIVAGGTTRISVTNLIPVAVDTDNTFGLSHTVIAGHKGHKVETTSREDGEYLGHFGQGFPMRIRLICSMVALLAGMGTALAQGPSSPAGTAPGSPVKIPAASPDTAPRVMPGVDGGTLPGTDPAIDNGMATEPGFAPGGVAGRGYDPTRAFGSFEYLLWKLKDAPTPPTQLTLPFTATGLNQEQTTIGLPGASIDYGGRSGGRITLGYWFDTEHTCGLEASYFQFERRDGSILTAQQANLNLNVTIIQNIPVTTITAAGPVVTIQQTPINVALPSTLTVAASGAAGPTDFWGGEINARSTRCYFGGLSIDLIGGFRFLTLAEEFLLNETITLQTANSNTLFVNGPITSNAGIPAIPPAVTGLQVVSNTASLNNISTRNTFYGAQAGASWDWRVFDRLSFQGWGKIGVGAMVESFSITSTTTTTSGALGTTTVPGGILPVTGFLDQGRTRYAVIPEFNLTLAYRLCDRVKATLGYNFLYMSSVLRPGDQIAFNNSSTQINIAGTQNSVATVQPAFSIKDTDFWAQGLTVGLAFQY